MKRQTTVNMEHLDQTHTLKLYKLGARLRETLTIDSKFDQVELELVFFLLEVINAALLPDFITLL